MRAAVIQKDMSVKVQEVPTPSVEAGTLLLKTIYCSICGSDIEYLDQALKNVPGFETYVGGILGHEWVAEVAAVGDGVEGWSVGDRAAYCLAKRTCGQCYYCRRGLYHLCLGGPSRGTVFGKESYGSRAGAMAEYFVKRANFAQPVPEIVTSEEACLAEPLATGIGSVNAAGLRLGDSAVIIGAGRIGLAAMLCAKANGAAPIIVIDLLKSRLDKALELGAHFALNASDTDVVSAVLEITEAGSDAVLICVRDGRVLNEAVQMVRRGGSIALTGFMAPMEVHPAIWIEKQVTIKAHWSGPVTAALNLMANKIIDVRPLISEIMPLEEVQRGFDSMRSGENIAVLLKP